MDKPEVDSTRNIMQVRFIESSDTFWPETPTASPSNESKSEIQIFKIFKIFLEKLN